MLHEQAISPIRFKIADFKIEKLALCVRRSTLLLYQQLKPLLSLVYSQTFNSSLGAMLITIMYINLKIGRYMHNEPT